MKSRSRARRSPACRPGPAPRAPRRRRGSTSTRSPGASCAVRSPRGESASSRSLRTLGSSAVEETDRPIVGLLAADGRMSFTDLGKATGLSTSAVHQRVKRLEKRGVITGYGADVDHERLGLAADRVRLDHADRPVAARRLPRAAARHRGDRVVLVGGRRRVLHPQGAGGDARRPRGRCSRGSGRWPTSRRAPRSCSPRRTRTARSPDVGHPTAVLRRWTTGALDPGRTAFRSVGRSVVTSTPGENR